MNLIRKHSIHIFPLVIVLLVIGLSIFKVSGSSIGVYNNIFYKDPSHAHNLVFGKPNEVRSDEFLVITQLTMIQVENDFSMINPLQNGGKDVSVVLDVPYIEWSTIFKPQNFPFYFLPLEHAFALKWWGMLGALLISSYYLFLRLLSRKHILLAAAGSLLISCSPFVFWWYQAGTIMTLTYGFLIILLSLIIIDQRAEIKKLPLSSPHLLIMLGLLSFVLVCFALNIYPPFQIPIALVATAFIFGYLLKIASCNIRLISSQLILFLIPLGIALIVIAGFIATRRSTIDAITHTVYPGSRLVKSGEGYYRPHLFTTYLQPQLQRDSRGSNYIVNQSESSNFIVTSIVTLVPSLYLIVQAIRRRKYVDPVLATTTTLSALFTAHILLPLPPLLTKLSFLSSVPQQRLIIGLGFLGVLQLMYLAHLSLHSKASLFTRKFVLIFMTGLVLLSVLSGYETIQDFPKFISSFGLVLVLLAPFAIGIYLFLSKHIYLGTSFLAAFSVLSIIFVNPLYVGLAPLTNNQLVNTVRKVSNSSAKWGVVDGTLLNNVPLLAGRQSVSGIEFYPNTSYWQKKLGKQYEFVYNRYAHITLSDHPYDTILMQTDLFMVSVQCDKPVVKDIQYLLSTKPIHASCLSLKETVTYPAATYYIYKVVH